MTSMQTIPFGHMPSTSWNIKEGLVVSQNSLHQNQPYLEFVEKILRWGF